MKSKLLKFIIVFVIICAAIAFGEGQSAILYLKGDYIDFNHSDINDYNKVTMIKGEISGVYGQFAEMTESRKSYGITTGKTVTNYYLVGINDTATNKKVYEDFDSDPAYEETFIVVLSSSRKDMQDKLDANMDGWQDLLNGKTDKVPAPVQFEGKLWKQPTDSEYITYRDDFVRDCGFDTSQVAEFRMVDNPPVMTDVIIACIAALLTIIGIVFIIVGLISARGSKSSGDFY
ncbi:DUF6709 family protein [Ruminococcus sp.]|uniref:DUF6709 family protein n=1 Tax=Ruminococcus sp. TaxID=41978 RepID=UPI001B77EA51|nr:DUF6709 family protein [Ruminococcus sp.]MBP5432022.1 hypothetical protein [Ruminococcus sp.]